MSDADDQPDDEVEEAPGVDEWLAVESGTETIEVGREDAPSEE